MENNTEAGSNPSRARGTAVINESYFISNTGDRFRFRENIPDNPRGAVIAVHGLAEHIGRYAHVEQFLVDNRYSFHMMENRGHGKSVGKRGHIDRFDQFTEDLHFFRGMVQKKIGSLPLFMLGHSNGSLISARYALTYGSGIRGFVLSGLPIRFAAEVSPLKKKIGLFLSRFIPKLTIKSELNPWDICHDVKVVEDYIADPLVFKIMSIGFANQIFWAMDDLSARAGEFNSPVLFQHGGDDRICCPTAAREFYEKAASTDKEFILYEGLYHEIYNEPEKDAILETALRWIEKRSD